MYSFGVVMVELLTGKRAVRFNIGPGEEKNLAKYFINFLAEREPAVQNS